MTIWTQFDHGQDCTGKHRIANDATDLEWAARRLATLEHLDDDPRAAHVTTLISTIGGDQHLKVADEARPGSHITTDTPVEVRR